MRCYYDVLGVDRAADNETIRKAYRRLAIKLHPDKALQRGEDADIASELFRELQAAYECLSDGEERAFYDANREAILRGVEVEAEAVSPGSKRYSSNKREAATEVAFDGFEAQLWPYFRRCAYDGMDDFDPRQSSEEPTANPVMMWTAFALVIVANAVAAVLVTLLGHDCAASRNWSALCESLKVRALPAQPRRPGFFPCYAAAFAEVDRCEGLAAAANDIAYEQAPRFGSSNSDWADVAKFYAYFQNFRSIRSFREAQRPDLRDACASASRHERKHFEAHAAAARLEARRDYENTVRRLAAYCKRRDPRVAKKRRQEAIDRETLAREQDQLKEKKRAAFERARRAWLEENESTEAAQDNNSDSDHDDDYTSLDCSVCDKVFKSRQALERHLATRTHQKRMAAEAASIGQDASTSVSGADVDRQDPVTSDTDGGDSKTATESVQDSEQLQRIDFVCSFCERSFVSMDALERHNLSRLHRNTLRTLKRRQHVG